jgi:hypothetical protein
MDADELLTGTLSQFERTGLCVLETLGEADGA